MLGGSAIPGVYDFPKGVGMRFEIGSIPGHGQWRGQRTKTSELAPMHL
jgi:hypothetical protein